MEDFVLMRIVLFTVLRSTVINIIRLLRILNINLLVRLFSVLIRLLAKSCTSITLSRDLPCFHTMNLLSAKKKCKNIIHNIFCCICDSLNSCKIYCSSLIRFSWMESDVEHEHFHKIQNIVSSTNYSRSMFAFLLKINIAKLVLSG